MQRSLAFRRIIPSLIVSVALLACASATPQEKSAAAGGTYEADMLACVESSPTREASQACRRKVREYWHVDGGAR